MAAGRAFRVTRTTHDGRAKPNADMFTVERYCLNFQRESSGDDWEPIHSFAGQITSTSMPIDPRTSVVRMLTFT